MEHDINVLTTAVVLLAFGLLVMMVLVAHTSRGWQATIESRDRWRNLAKSCVAGQAKLSEKRLEMLHGLMNGVPIQQAAVEEAQIVLQEIRETIKPDADTILELEEQEIDCT